MSLEIVADENMPGLEALSKRARVRRLPGRAISPSDLRHAQALLVRSVTRVNEPLLAGSAVRFVGSATIGTDHVDQAWLARAGITFRHAPGCNARAVAEYVLQAVLRFAVGNHRDPATLSGAVIGCGAVGTRVRELWRALGMRVMVHDPPLRRAGALTSREHVDLETALRADVISLHTPLTGTGEHATHHLLAERQLSGLHAGQLLINSSRGPVVDNAALLRRLQTGEPPQGVLDVWEGEPEISEPLFRHCLMGTPHVAGYSREGKLRGSAMVERELCEWLGWQVEGVAIEPPSRPWQGDVERADQLLALLCERYDMARDHRALEASFGEARPSAAFDRLRRDYPVRHECSGLRVTGRVAPALEPILRSLGVTWNGAVARPSPGPGRPSGSLPR